MLFVRWACVYAYFTGRNMLKVLQRYYRLLTSGDTSEVEVQHAVFLRVVVAIRHIDIKFFTKLSFSHAERFRLAVEDVIYCNRS